MIPKSQIYIGAWIVENDPEEQAPIPYKGKVIAIKETGKGEMDYFVSIRLDDESMYEAKKNLPLLSGQDNGLFSMSHRLGEKAECGA